MFSIIGGAQSPQDNSPDTTLHAGRPTLKILETDRKSPTTTQTEQKNCLKGLFFAVAMTPSLKAMRDLHIARRTKNLKPGW